jgi:hypothetical protein
VKYGQGRGEGKWQMQSGNNESTWLALAMLEQNNKKSNAT